RARAGAAEAVRRAVPAMKKGRRALLAMAVYVAVLAACVQLRWAPREEERGLRAARVEALQKEVRALEVVLEKRPEFRQQVQQLDSKFDAIDQILPEQPRLDTLEARLSAHGATRGVEIVRLVPGRTVAKDSYSEVPFELQVRGPRAAVLAFV